MLHCPVLGGLDALNFINMGIPFLGRIERKLSNMEGRALYLALSDLRKKQTAEGTSDEAKEALKEVFKGYANNYVDMLGYYDGKYNSHYRRLYKAPSLVLLREASAIYEKARPMKD